MRRRLESVVATTAVVVLLGHTGARAQPQQAPPANPAPAQQPGQAASPQQPASAAEGDKEKGDKEKGAKQGGVVNPVTGKRLNEAVEQINSKKFAEARATLGKIDLGRLSPYESGRVEQLFAAVEQAEGRYGAARDHLQKAIASGGLNDPEIQTARYQIAQLFMAEDKWKEGVEALKQWFATAQNPNSAAYHLLAVGYYQLRDHKSALEPAQKAVDMSGGKPQETWVQLLLALRLEREEYKLAVPLVKHLIEAAPATKNYWLQLAAVNGSLGSFDDAEAAMQLAYYAGLLTGEQDLQRLAELLVRISIPFRAAQLLSEATEQGRFKGDAKVYELLANCWVAAREYEKAIQPLKRAADLSDSGELYLRLGEVYVQREEWANASGALRSALEKGKLKNPGNAQLLMGLSLYNQKKLQDALTWFQRAREHGETRNQGEAWLRHVEERLGSEAKAEAATVGGGSEAVGRR